MPPIVETRGEAPGRAGDGIDPARDCPECSSAGSVTREFCEVCYAEVGEYCEPGGAVVPPVAVVPHALDRRLALHPSIRFRFTDVVDELRAIAELASEAVEVEGSRLAMACRRAESLLRVLRLQFMEDVVFEATRTGGSA